MSAFGGHPIAGRAEHPWGVVASRQRNARNVARYSGVMAHFLASYGLGLLFLVVALEAAGLVLPGRRR